MTYKFETNSTPLAAFIKAKYTADIEFDTQLDSSQKRVIFVFHSNTIDFKDIETIFLKSFANTYYNELQILKNLVRTLIPFKKSSE